MPSAFPYTHNSAVLLRCFHQPLEQAVHFASRFLVEPEANRAAHKRVLENALAQKQMLEEELEVL